MPVKKITGFAVCYAFVILIPWWTNAPVAGLDASWEWMLHWARATHQQFGSDIVWPYGPLGFVYSPQYHSSSFVELLYIRFILIISLCSSTYYLINPLRSATRCICFALLIISSGYTLDALYISLLLLLMHQQFFRYNVPHWVLNLLLVSLALSSLIKFSVLLMCVCAFAMLSVWQLKQRIFPYALCAYSVALLVLWGACNQQFYNILSYVRWNIELSTYFHTMAKTGPWQHIALFIISGVLLGCTYLTNIKHKGVLFYALTVGGILFLSYKAGFTRHDALRSLLPFVILFQLYILYTYHSTRILSKIIWGGGCILCFAGSVILYTHYSFPGHRHNSYTLSGLVHRLSLDRTTLNKKFTATQQQGLPVIEGTADIYMHELALLLAHDMNDLMHYRPRPVPQSYSAYSPDLQQLNAKHITADTLYVELLTIDNRLPALQDAPSWLQWLRDFDVTRIITNEDGRSFAVLKRKQHSDTISLSAKSHHAVSFGDTLHIDSEDITWATVTIEKTWLGSVVSFFYKPEMLNIHIELQDGRRVTHRFIPEMAHHGFILSPYIHHASQLKKMMLHQPQPHLQVKTLSISGESSANIEHWFYQSPHISLQRIIR